MLLMKTTKIFEYLQRSFNLSETNWSRNKQANKFPLSRENILGCASNYYFSTKKGRIIGETK